MDEDFQEKALRLVTNYLVTNEQGSRDFNLRVTWFCKTLDNWKAIISDIEKGGKFYEVTYSGVNKDTNIDVYVKTDKVRIKD